MSGSAGRPTFPGPPLRRGIGPTYRLQLTEERGFAWAAGLVPYLARLGIATVYLSPVVEAVPGSTHGYDGTDPTRLRGGLGGADGYQGLVEACAAHRLGILVDWVPNHLATWPGGRWWRRLLAGGRHCEMGSVFDVEWEAGAPGERGKVALPLLDRPLSEALAAGLIGIGAKDGLAVLEVAGTDLPIAGGATRPGEEVAEVLAAQHYRLVDWHDGTQRNYRRFFDIDGLCGIRVEDADVFHRTHGLLAELARAGALSGVRIDHVDGLAEPRRYLRRLAALVDVPIVVEKILTGDETLPPGWPVLGTTGYEAVDDIGGALVDASGLDRLVAAGRADGDLAVEELTTATRRSVARTSFAAELGRLAGRLSVPVDDLTETVVHLDRYRTYLHDEPSHGHDEPSHGHDEPSHGHDEPSHGHDEPSHGHDEPSHGHDEPSHGHDEPSGGQLAGPDARPWTDAAGHDPARRAVAEAVLDPANRDATVALQQRTGAVMAKGVEDTAWYRLSGPLAFCEVGGDPARARYDGWERLLDRSSARRPGLVPGTTHDTKRSQDVRCRLYALTARADEFERGLGRLRALLGPLVADGDLAAESRTLAQLLLGFLPPLAPGAPDLGLAPEDAAWPAGYALTGRLGAALVKGAREAKAHSSWTAPDPAYEERLEAMAAAALADGASLTRRAFGPLVDEIDRLGATLSLSAVVLRHLIRGVPDCFEGDEAWNLSLVDPDNRRPVDTDRLDQLLSQVATAAAPTVDSLRRRWRTGAVKLLVTHRCLAAATWRRDGMPPTLPMGGQLPVEVVGPRASSVGAVAWQSPDRPSPGRPAPRALAVVTRLPGRLAAPGDDLPHGPSYADLTLTLRDGGAAGGTWRDLLTGRTVTQRGEALRLEEVLALLPVAVLAEEQPEP